MAYGLTGAAEARVGDFDLSVGSSRLGLGTHVLRRLPLLLEALGQPCQCPDIVGM